jgi:hypothetical protein
METIEKILNGIAVFIVAYSIVRFCIWCVVVTACAVLLASVVALTLSRFPQTKKMSIQALFISTAIGVLISVLLSVAVAPENHIFSFGLLPAFFAAIVSYGLSLWVYYKMDSILGQ